MPHTLHVLCILVPHMPYVLRFLLMLVPRVIYVLLLLILHCFRCFKPNILICISCLVALMSFGSCVLVLELFEFFTAWAKVNHCNIPVLKKEHHYNGFFIIYISLQDLLTSLVLTNFMPLISFYSPSKHRKLWFSGSRERDHWHGMV